MHDVRVCQVEYVEVYADELRDLLRPTRRALAILPSGSRRRVARMSRMLSEFLCRPPHACCMPEGNAPCMAI